MKYYRTDSRKISLGEYWNISRGGRFLFAALYKLLGIPLKLTEGIPEPQPLRDRLIEAGTIPPAIFSQLNSGIRDFQQLGFDQFWFYTLKNSLTSGSSYGVLSLHSSHHTLGKIIYVSIKAHTTLVLALMSELGDGTVFATSNKKQDFNQSPQYIAQRAPGAGAARLWELHQMKLEGLSRTRPPKKFTDFDQVAAFDDRFLRLSYDDKIRRGIWVEMTEAEVAALRAKRPPPLPA
jgi:hypothetical protein